jgi:hypothetical protein
MEIAKRSDWKIKDMPLRSESVAIDRLYSREEFEKIAAGLIPKQMEDHWFIFYDEPWLYLHRSWTGFCVFKVRFESIPELAEVVEAWVNREPTEWRAPDINDDVNLLEFLLDARAGRDLKSIYGKQKSSNSKKEN